MAPEAQHIAHFNWGTLIAEIGSPKVAEFVDAVERVNAIAERSEGFVWRHGDEMAAAQSIKWPLFRDPRVIASFSVWRRPGDFESFVYKTVHGAFVRRRESWFIPGGAVSYVLWQVPAGTEPTIEDARARVDLLLEKGPHDAAFDLNWARAHGVC